MPNTSEYICYLCGKTIQSNLEDAPMGFSRDHVPPKQFYPKQIRVNQNLNLDWAPSHKSCNEKYKSDEEYFYHCMYPAVERPNPNMAKIIHEDLLRRSEKPQTQIIARKLLGNIRSVTKGGIHLPEGTIQIALDGERIKRIAAKIARGILFISTERYFEEQSIVHMDFYTDPSEIIEPYKQTLRLNRFDGVCQDVFAHSHINFEGKGYRFLLMLFWKAFMFCVIVEDKETNP
jgi:hypothetical protein